MVGVPLGGMDVPIIATHVIDKAGIPVVSLSVREEPLEPELLSAIVTTLRTLTASTTAKGDLENFSIGGTQFYAIPVKGTEYIIVVSIENQKPDDLDKLNEIKRIAAENHDKESLSKALNEVITKKFGMREKTKQWAKDIWG